MSVEAPLSFGQLYSWREVDSYPQGWKQEANLPATWDLRGHSLDQVKVALRRLFDRHEPLRTTFHVGADGPVQRVHRNATPPISHVDRVITDFGDPDRTTVELLGRPFEMTDALCWRGVLVTSAGAPMFLSMAFSHLILDVWSIQELQTQFRTLLADPDPDPDHDPDGAGAAADPDGPTAANPAAGTDCAPREMAHRERAEAARGRREGAERYWRRVLSDELAGQLPTLPAGVQRNRIQATLHSHRLGSLTARAAKLHGVTAPAVLMALVAAGLSRHTGAPRVAVSVMSSNRFSPAATHIVGTLNQLIPVVATVDPDAALAAHIQQWHWAAAKAYRHSAYDIDSVTALAAQLRPRAEHDCWFNSLFQCWFNYLQLDGEPPDASDTTPAELAWTPLARQYGQPFDVRVTVRDGRTSVALRVDPDIISAAGLTDILRMVALGAQRAVVDPQSTLRDLCAAIEAELAPEIFPSRSSDLE